MPAADLPALNNCTNTLLGKLLAAQTDLEDLQRKAFPNRCEIATMNEIRDTIAGLELRLKRSMLAQAAAFAGSR